MKKILFTGGGSAGHVIPNVAIFEELLQSGEADVGYIGTNGIEKGIVAPYKIPYMEITCPKLIRGGGFSGFKRNLSIPLAFSRAVKEAKAHLATFQPDLVFSKGGYVSLPVVFAAYSMGIPCFAHESDLSAGLANRLAAKKCRYVFTSFPETAEHIRNGKYSGAPMRRALFSVSRKAARKQFGFGEKEKVLLVFGGGSGSAAINEAIRQNIKAITEKYSVLHVCGKGNVVKSNVKNYVQTEFIADMGSAYACADAVISRAGAGTVFELVALKKPALLIPLAGQTRGDQKENAEYFRRKGLCRVLEQSRLENVAQEIELLFEDDGLKSRLTECFPLCGNENILRELRKALSE
ncbi:MAG: UDP-N-acetylglucosamine--N-acetylmuramyl-(pentapeptide) pyrophosphoryl-undecaprenol N-acetylglucosamine transferase [Clostridia bacterium]|nr:UDP-N-acetylglucosamine--N-acetylmuramyl-(pentapeptide) pyrophosphoryl-undecaprenol N-acetylglucosamine transferase [Clostridia bacterium]